MDDPGCCYTGGGELYPVLWVIVHLALVVDWITTHWYVTVPAAAGLYWLAWWKVR